MSTLTIAPTQSTALREKIAEAKKALREMLQSERGLRENASDLHTRAWILGAHLADLKEEIGHGKWLLWLPAHFPDLGSNDSARTENASRCIRFYRDNPNIGNSRHLKAPKEFNIDAIRKLMWGYIPEKERPQLAGNESVNPEPHYLTFVNHYLKFRRQAKLGRVTLPSLSIMRRDFEPTVRDMMDLLGRDWFLTLLTA